MFIQKNYNKKIGALKAPEIRGDILVLKILFFKYDWRIDGKIQINVISNFECAHKL